MKCPFSSQLEDNHALCVQGAICGKTEGGGHFEKDFIQKNNHTTVSKHENC